MVGVLDEIFSAFDGLAERLGLEKIKTIGDAYMVVAGLPDPRPDHAAAAAEMALAMQAELGRLCTALDLDLAIRIGMQSGPVIAGVIGRRKFIYDLWGDTVNTASRMESQRPAGSDPGHGGRLRAPPLDLRLRGAWRGRDQGQGSPPHVSPDRASIAGPGVRAPEPAQASATDRAVRLGLRANLGQFALLVAVNALVGGMIGQERTVLPLLATDVFGLTGFVSALTFVVAFGLAKAATNLAAGALADRFGRKPVLVAGWLVGLPVPLLIILAPSWAWVVAANLLLGVNQGLTWSTTVIMKIDLVGPVRRGLATGINEAAGYGAVAVHGARDGLDRRRAGLRPGPFLLGLAYAVPRPRGIGAARPRDARPRRARAAPGRAAGRPALARGLLAHDAARPSLSAASQAGLVNNLNDGMAWGLLPLFYASAGLSLGRDRRPGRDLPGGLGGRPGRDRRDCPIGSDASR